MHAGSSITWGILAVLFDVSLTLAQPTPAFVTRQPQLTGGIGSVAVAAADLDGDGNLDLAVANSGSDDVTIFWGNGDGTFVAAAATLPVQAPSANLIIETPVAIAIADVTGDGKPDIVTANEGGNSISVLPNQGQQAFGAAIESPTGFSPEALVIADFNGDKTLDAATANLLDDTVSVLIGKGDGTFTAGSPVPVGASPSGLAVADLNHDAKLDLVVANSEGGPNFVGSVTVLQGDGSGGFAAQPEITSTVFDHPVAITAADVNGDGNQDVVIVNDFGDSLSLALGKGDLTFQNPTQLDLSVGSMPNAVVVADLNGDGVLDLAVSASFQDAVSVFAGSRTGTFAAPRDFTITPASAPAGITAGDLNKDGRLDLVTANDIEAGTISVLLNASCVGDCGDNGAVTVDEILTMVNIALGNVPASQCVAGDANGDHQITVDEILAAVSRALSGCTA